MKQNIIKFKSLAFGICATCMVLVTGCSESEYAKINTDPSTIAEGNPVFLFTQEQVQYQPSITCCGITMGLTRQK